MTVEVLPPVDESVRQLVEAALDPARSDDLGAAHYGDAWRLAGLHEGVGRLAADDEGYALSPRRTRGATRA